jgi:hypothetical protein
MDNNPIYAIRPLITATLVLEFGNIGLFVGIRVGANVPRTMMMIMMIIIVIMITMMMIVRW